MTRAIIEALSQWRKWTESFFWSQWQADDVCSPAVRPRRCTIAAFTGPHQRPRLALLQADSAPIYLRFACLDFNRSSTVCVILARVRDTARALGTDGGAHLSHQAVTLACWYSSFLSTSSTTYLLSEWGFD